MNQKCASQFCRETTNEDFWFSKRKHGYIIHIFSVHRYCCVSSMLVYHWRVTWNYFYRHPLKYRKIRMKAKCILIGEMNINCLTSWLTNCLTQGMQRRGWNKKKSICVMNVCIVTIVKLIFMFQGLYADIIYVITYISYPKLLQSNCLNILEQLIEL